MKKLKNIISFVLKDIGQVLGGISEKDVFALLRAVNSSRRIYITGSGRSFYSARAFAQRLYQSGIDVYVQGDTNLPPAGPGDTLIACSASGETSSVLCAAGRARAAGCSVAAVTARADSSLAAASDITVAFPLPVRGGASQPMGSLFEQSAFLFFDCCIIILAEMRGLGFEDLKTRHGNLE
jgi:6-phospho-3-hexuloisomerase